MEIQEIKQQLSIQLILKNYGLSADKNSMLNCPFHGDKNASMKIYLNTNTFNCFGCGANGDTIEFIQIKENISKHQAILKPKDFIPGDKKYNKYSPCHLQSYLNLSSSH